MKPQDKTQRHATVIGAGIVGVCCALYLQRDGHEVTLMDYQGPGEACSMGNAGQISPGTCTPHAMPGIVLQVPGMLLDPLGPLAIRWRYLPRLAPWLLRLAFATTKNRVEAISIALRELHRGVFTDYEELTEGTGAEKIFRRAGRMELYESERSFAAAGPSRELMQRRGVEVEILAAERIRELQPGLGFPYRYGTLRHDSMHVTDPRTLVQALAADFERRGGTPLTERVVDFEMNAAGPARMTTEAGSHPVDVVVVAAGAYSRKLVRALGTRVPLDTERGYHMALPNPGVEVRLPIMSADHHFALTPMENELRLAGTDEFAGIEAPPNYARADRLLQAARRMFPDLNAEGATRWMGCRPSMPDSLPVISRSPRYPSVFFAFGHGHFGLSGAPMTGRLIADMLAGRSTPIDAVPYRVDRFWP